MDTIRIPVKSFLFRALVKALPLDRSYAFSALGLVVLLLLLLRAGSGISNEEIIEAIGGVVSDQSIIEMLKIVRGDESIEQADAIFGREVKFSKQFIKEAKTIFDADISPLLGLDQINNWCSKQTHGHIDEIMSELDSKVKIIMLDALFFKADWESPFRDSNTIPMIFTKFDGTESTINMMRKTERMGYWNGEYSSAVTLHYSGETGVVAIPILPKTKGMEGMKLAMDEVFLNNDIGELLNESFERKKINLSIPRTHIETGGSLSGLLKDMNMVHMFEDAGTREAFGVDTAVDDVVQRCVLDLDEKGTTAAAVTGMTMKTLSFVDVDHPLDFILDRPFLLLLIHKPTNLILFGAIVDE